VASIVALFMLIAFMTLAVAPPAAAHADLASTSPLDKEVSTEPVERIELVFTDAVEVSGSGVRLLDGNGGVIGSSAFSASETTIAVIPDEPLGTGRYAVVWQVESKDGHEIPGSISFEVALAAADGSEEQAAEAPGGEASPDTTPTTVSSTPTTVVITHTPAAISTSAAQDPFAADDPNSALTRILGFVGRWATLSGALLAIGAFAFATTSLVGSRLEVQRSVRWIRRGAVLVLVGTLVEVTSVVLVDLAADQDLVAAIIDLLASSFGVSVVLRLAGGAAMLMDPGIITMSPIPAMAAGAEAADDDGSAVPGGGSRVATRAPTGYRLDARPEWVAIAGMIAVAASFMFDGHTVTAEPDLLARFAALVHVIAGGVWLGGLVVLADTLVARNRAGTHLDAATMGLRFSRVATVAIVAVGAAGLALAWTIIDDPGDIVSTTWGRLLLVKVALVLVAGAIGAYNHFAVVPRMDSTPGNAEGQATLRRTVTIEAALLLAVAVLTAALVVAVI
jgi:copper transport protein